MSINFWIIVVVAAAVFIGVVVFGAIGQAAKARKNPDMPSAAKFVGVIAIILFGVGITIGAPLVLVSLGANTMNALFGGNPTTIPVGGSNVPVPSIDLGGGGGSGDKQGQAPAPSPSSPPNLFGSQPRPQSDRADSPARDAARASAAPKPSAKASAAPAPATSPALASTPGPGSSWSPNPSGPLGGDYQFPGVKP